MKRALLSSLALLLAALPAAAQTFEARGAAGDIQVKKSAGGWQVEMNQVRTPLPIAPATQLTTLRAEGGAFVVAGVERGNQSVSLVVVRGQNGKVEKLNAPVVAPGEMAMALTPVLGPAGLEALFWIDGKNAQAGAVKVALWDGQAFGATGTLAPAGPGTQTGLQVLRLADGSWLAVWSAYDGQDDELMWSRGSKYGFSPAKKLTDNAVPDVTPTLRRSGDGAILVWSFYDGSDYRLKSTTFKDWSFTDGEVFGGKGASLPSFTDNATPTLTFRQVEPESWRVVELNAEGKKVREASIAAATRRSPRVLAIDDKAVTFEWSASDAEASPVSFVVPWEETKNQP